MFNAVITCAVLLLSRAGAYPLQVVLNACPNNIGSCEGQRGAVACENRLCSSVGTDLLRAGGNAADAMVGTVLCVGVTSSWHSGLGGGGFMLVRAPNGTYEHIDFRETAPKEAAENMYDSNLRASIRGGLSSGVPGEIRGLEYLHEHYGRLSWRHVMQPAIKLARNGFVVDSDAIRYFTSVTKDYDFLSRDASWALDFAPNGTRVGLGDCMTRKRYADTLEAISEHGADAFYHGPIAEATIRAVQSSDGIMTMEDLEHYSVVSRPAVQISYRDYRISTCGSPAGGGVVASALKTIEGFSGVGSPEHVNLSTHRIDEAVRFAYGERTALGDPGFLNGSRAFEEHMVSEKSAAYRRSKISDTTTLNITEYDPANYEILSDGGTSHIVTADASGMAVSLTSTVNLIFGSLLIVPETGVIMNDQMNDFSIPHKRNEFGFVPSPANYIRPFKRPLSSMAPTIVEHAGNGSLYYVVGAAGGSRIITAVLQNLIHVLDGNMSVAEALDQPRFHDQLLPNSISFEWSSSNDTDSDEDGQSNGEIFTRAESGIGNGEIRGYDNATVAFMVSRGHNVTWVPPGYSSAQALRLLWNGTFEAAGDPRQAQSGGEIV